MTFLEHKTAKGKLLRKLKYMELRDYGYISIHARICRDWTLGKVRRITAGEITPLFITLYKEKRQLNRNRRLKK